MEEKFINAIRCRNKVKLTFYSKEDAGVLTRTCAPMDYGPSRLAFNKADRYHLWDYDSDKQQHILSLLPEQIVSMETLQETFSPSEFITWNTDWLIGRDWGDYS